VNRQEPSSPTDPRDWLAASGFLAELGRREGTLMSLAVEGRTVTVRGHGNGRVTIAGPGRKRAGPYEVAEAMEVLAGRGAFDPYGDWGSDFTSGSWDAGEIATVIAPWYDLGGGGQTEFAVDEIEMCTDGHGHADPLSPAQAEALTLATFQWELEGGSGGPGNADSGDVVLLRIGPRYVIYQCSAGDVIADALTAASDQEAIALFHESNLPPP
jgi:hypothetical protein